MGRNFAVGLALVAVVVLAGCSGLSGSSDASPGTPTLRETPDRTTTGGAATEATPGSSPTVDDGAGPDGEQRTLGAVVTDPNVTDDAESLVAVNARLLRGARYAATAWINVTDGDGDVTRRRFWTVAGSDGAYRFGNVRRGSVPELHDDVWSNGTVEAARYRERRGHSGDWPSTHYLRTIAPGGLPENTALGRVSSYLDAGRYTVSDVTEPNGTRRITLTTDGNRDTTPAQDGDDPRLREGRLVVSGSGLIQSFSASLVESSDDGAETVRYDVDYDLETVGTATVERPSWVDTALEEAPRVGIDATVVDDAYVAVENTGAEPIQPAWRLYLRTDSELVSHVVPERRVGPGERRYLYYDRSRTGDVRLRISSTPPTEPLGLPEYVTGLDIRGVSDLTGRLYPVAGERFETGERRRSDAA